MKFTLATEREKIGCIWVYLINGIENSMHVPTILTQDST